MKENICLLFQVCVTNNRADGSAAENIKIEDSDLPELSGLGTWLIHKTWSESKRERCQETSQKQGYS